MSQTRQDNLTPKAKKLYKKLVASYKKISNQQKLINSCKQRLKNAEQFNNEKLQKLLHYVNKATFRFILCQIRNQKYLPRGRLFTIEEKVMAVTLLKASGRGYRLLSTMFALPSKKSCLNFLNKCSLLPGLNEKMFDVLKGSVEKWNPKTDIVLLSLMRCL